jgi:hypothetical protein
MVAFETILTSNLLNCPRENYVKRQRSTKAKIVRAQPATKSLSVRYAEVVRLRQAILRTQSARPATTEANRLASK